VRDEAERNPALQKIILNLASLTERIRGNVGPISEPTALAAEEPGEYKAPEK